MFVAKAEAAKAEALQQTPCTKSEPSFELLLLGLGYTNEISIAVQVTW